MVIISILFYFRIPNLLNICFVHQEIILILFSVFFLVQLYYWLYYFAKAAFYKPVASNDPVPPVSIVVAAWNELENLQKLIPVLMAQKYPNFDIIIVNDRSDDGTYDYLRELTIEHNQIKALHVDVTPERMSPKKFAITLGVRASSYDWVVFTDADCMPVSDNWLMEVSKACKKDKEIVLGFSGFKEYAGWLNRFIRFETLLTGLTYMGMGLRGNAYMGVGRNLAYRKSLFMKHNGLPHMDILSGDDDLFVNQYATKTNTAVVISEEGQTTSEPKRTFNEWLVQKKRHVSVGKLYNFSSKFTLSNLFLSQVFLYISVIILCLGMKYWEIAISLFVIRLIIVKFVMYKFAKKLNTKQEWYWIVVLEWLYMAYAIVLGVIGISTKKVRWK